MNDENDFIEQNRKWVSSLVYPYQKLGIAVEDLTQEAMIGLLEARRRYDADKGASFQTYATYWVKKRILAYVDKEFKESKFPVSSSQFPVSSSQCPDDVAAMSSSFPLSEGGRGVENDSLNLPEDMPTTEKQILNLYFIDKKSLVEIAKELDISRERVRQLKTKAMRRYKRNYLTTNN